MPTLMTDEEVEVALWEAARRLGHSKDELAGMLAKGKTPRTVLRTLTAKIAKGNREATKKADEKWLFDRAAKASEVHVAFMRETAAARLAEREQKSLPQRLADVLAMTTVLCENARTANLSGDKVIGGSGDGVPRLEGKPVVELVSDLSLVVVERVEEIADRLVYDTQQPVDKDGNLLDLNGLIVARKGPPHLVALRYGVSESQVRKLRATHGLEAKTGKPRLEDSKQEKQS